MPKNPQISALNEVGQSIWYDNLSRDVLRSGELASLISAGVSGLTSNPSIFKKSIADTSNYDADVRRLSTSGLTTEQICEDLMLQDVAAAADLLRPIYDSTKGADGHASVEVSPYLARDTQGTVQAAKRLWSKLARPNIMIKIPATNEGIPAIEECLAAGINVNVTLIFSVEFYRKVAQAYLRALQARARAGQEIHQIASVASFFVSRVDAICEKHFDALVKSGKTVESQRADFFGKVGIANSKLAYAEYERTFSGPDFAPLRAKGARPQRPLWASTGTKNPALSPVLYVEQLAGRDTVNTLPPATLKALMEKAEIGPRLHAGLKESAALYAHVKELGIPLDQLLDELQRDGVQLFSDAYKDLLASLETKRAAVH